MHVLMLSDAGFLCWVTAVQVASVSLLGFILSRSIGSYLDKKGTNRADAEDIAKLTKLSEQVLHEFRLDAESVAQRNREILEQLSHRNQLKMAALEKRLEVHQQAYTLWYEMFAKRFTKQEAIEVSVRAQEWWFKNSLYMTPDARQLFSQATNIVRELDDLSKREPNAQNAAALRSDNDLLRKAREAIIRGVELPSLGEDELEPNANAGGHV
jgi:hypothetical protein